MPKTKNYSEYFKGLFSSSVNRRISFGVFAGWGSKVISIIVNLTQIALLYRYLELELIGIWFLMTGAQLFIGLFDFGFGQTLQRRIAFSKGNCGSSPDTILNETAKQNIRDLIATTRRIYIAASGLVLLVLLIGGLLYFDKLEITPSSANNLRIAWFIMAFGYAANMWGWFVESTLNGLGDIGWSNAINSILWILALIVIWLALALGGGLIALSIIWIMRVLMLRVSCWIVVRHLHPWISETKGNWLGDQFRTMIVPSVKWWIAIIGTFLLTGTSRYFIGSYLGASAVSDYIATFTALMMIQAALISMVGVSTPLQSQMWKAGDVESIRRYVFNLTRVGLVLLIVFYAFICIYGKEIFELWLGKGHFVGYPVLITLSIMMILEAHHGMLNAPCIAAGKLQFYKYTLIGGAINVFLIILLVSRWGLFGIAFSIMIAHLVTNNWVIPKISLNLLNLPFRNYFTTVILPVSAAGALGLMVALMIKVICPIVPVSAVTYCIVILTIISIFKKQSAIRPITNSSAK